MKKTIPLIILLTSLVGNAQCPAPSNINVVDNIALLNNAVLSWSENGNSQVWEIAMMPNFNIGDSLPTAGTIALNNPYTLTDIPAVYGCYVFFIRSRCSVTEVSPWVAIGTSGCDTATNNYLAALLSNDHFNYENSRLQIFPNPSTNIVQLKSNSQIDKITVFDSLGKIILIQTQNNNQIDVAHLSNGFYLIEVVAGDKKMYSKFIKE